MVPVFGFGIGLGGAFLISMVAGMVTFMFLLCVLEGKHHEELYSLIGGVVAISSVFLFISVLVPRGYDGPATYTGVEVYHSEGKEVREPKVKIEGFDGLYEVRNTSIAAYKAGDIVDVHCGGYSCEVK